MNKHKDVYFVFCFCFLFLSSPLLSLAGPADDNSPAYALQKVAGRGDIKTVNKLLKQKENIDENEYLEGKTMAFVAAAQHGHANIVRLLLQQGVHIDAVEDGDDLTALSAAAANGRLAIMRMLIKLGANVNIKPDPGGSTALMYAAEKGQVKALQLLFAHAAKVNVYNDRGITALMLACYAGKLDVVKLLLKHGADVNLHPTEAQLNEFVDTQAFSPLMYAAANGHVAVVKELLVKGARLDAKDSDGRTALALAQKNGHAEITALLSSDK